VLTFGNQIGTALCIIWMLLGVAQTERAICWLLSSVQISSDPWSPSFLQRRGTILGRISAARPPTELVPVLVSDGLAADQETIEVCAGRLQLFKGPLWTKSKARHREKE